MGNLRVEYERGTWDFEPGTEITVGRNPDCSVVVSEPTVSRRHLVVQSDGQGWTVINTGSTGTYDSGRPVETLAVDTPTILHLGGPDGAEVRFYPSQTQSSAAPIESDGTITVSVDGTEATFRPGQLITVGRGAGCTFVIAEPTISRRHLSIEHNGREWVATDSSSSGTYAAGQRIESFPIANPITLTLGGVDGYRLGLWVPSSTPVSRGLPGGDRQGGSAGDLVSSSTHTEFRPLQEKVEAQQLTSPPLWLLLPFGAWVKSRRIRAGLPLFLLIIWIAPIVLSSLFSNGENQLINGQFINFSQGDFWAWSIYFGVLWAVLLWALIRPGSIPLLAMGIVVGFVCLAMGVFGTSNIVANLNQPEANKNQFTATLQVGVHEELTKALAVVLVIAIYEFLLHAPRLSIRGYMYLGALSGVTFGTVECRLYLNNYYIGTNNCLVNKAHDITSNVTCAFGNGLVPSTILFRAITDGFTHALWASISAFFIGLALLHRRWAVQFIVMGLGIAILFHAANDHFIGGPGNDNWYACTLIGVAALMTVGYAVSGNQIDKILGQIESTARSRSGPRSRARRVVT